MREDENLKSTEQICKELIDYSKELSKIDFDALERDGVIKKVRGGYEVLKHSQLPEIAHKLRKSLTPTKGGAKLIIFKPPQLFLNLSKK